jgi:uncharacterized protein (UPF0332 family)
MTSSVEALLAKARESIAAAQLLIKDGYFDFAASRAYYAMLYAASALLADLRLSYNSHSARQTAKRCCRAVCRRFTKTALGGPTTA